MPVGLIHTSWGGTPAEAWTSRGALEAEPMLKHYVENQAKALDNYPKAQDRYKADLAKHEEAVKKAKADVAAEDTKEEDRKKQEGKK